MEEQVQKVRKPKRGYLDIAPGKKYTAARVQKIVDEYKKRSAEDQKRAEESEAKYNRLVEKYKHQRVTVEQSRKKVWLKLGAERWHLKKSINAYKKKYERLRARYMEARKTYRSGLRKKVYKEVKSKHKFYDPNENINVNSVKIILWARIFAKLSLVRKKTKLRPHEMWVLLYLSQFPEGVTAKKYSEEMSLGVGTIYKFSRRLIQFGLVSRESYNKKPYLYFLTDRGKSFAETILNFVKKEKTVVKKIKPKYIRNNVSVSRAASSAGDNEQQSSAESTVL
jgi:DNA-binding MarR family transcriptional regulator